MEFPMRIFKSIALLAFLIAPAAAVAQSKATASAALDVSALRQGSSGQLAVILEVAPGYHAQSNTPTDDSAIKCELTLDAAAGVTFGAIVYPAGSEQTFPALG